MTNTEGTAGYTKRYLPEKAWASLSKEERREVLAAKAYDLIQCWMEEGNSQLLSREQALEIAAWGLKIAGERELQHHVLAELVELPEEAIQPL